ncbi:sensor histidine kinase [Peterkaempfera griseoplana]|uniref:sensor histidine kinase n=1 Tax=Peterkaempfera griseoplana TaxID=66896 RepID=UPI0006E264DD|nr:HAMP domain-containing sensor histidine kinase [Peterkaempfera griseoplana]
MRLSTRTALAVGATVPLLVLACGLLLLRLVASDLHTQLDTQLRQRAAAVLPEARSLLRATANQRPAAVEQARQRRLYTAALDVGVRLAGPQGSVEGGPQPDDSVPLPQQAARPTTLRAGGAGWRVLSVPVTVTRPSAQGTLWLFAPDTATATQLRLVRRRVLTVALLAAPLSGALAWAVTARVSRPLRRLQRRTSGLDPSTSAARLDHSPSGITEVDDLARTLQTVLARYDEQAARTAEALATARSFSAAASHELRTPLMSMQTNLEIITAHPGLAGADREEVLDDLAREHARLLGLLVMLRTLAQGDLVEADAMGPVDLAEPVDAAAAELRRRHPEAVVTVRAATGLRVHGWEPGLRSLVDNLLANAIVHGRPETGPPRVEITLRAGGDRARPTAVLTVDDHGPGIPGRLRDAVFQRFHRRPGSPGSGLGLTLVAQQIALHRGTVTVQDRPGGGTRFEVRLALAAQLPGPSGEPTLPLRRDWLTAAAVPQEFHKDGP